MNDERKKCERTTCAETFLVTPSMRRRKFCSDACKKAAWHEPKEDADLGPSAPLGGWTEAELADYKSRRLAQLIAEGLPNEAIAERLGMTTRAVEDAATVRGGPPGRRSRPLPLGLPT